MRILKYLSVFLLVFSNLFAQDIQLKSIKAYTNDVTELPVLIGGRLNIEFDIQSDYEPSLSIVFRFCDKNWKPYDNVFLINYGKNIEPILEFDILPFTVEDARYHFSGSFPNKKEYVTFPFSGKWMFYITDSQDTSIVYSKGKFFVINPEVALNVSKLNEVLEDKVYTPPVLSRIFNITTEFILPGDFHPSFVDHLEIIENHKIYYPIIVDREGNTNQRQFYWNGDRKFTFTARDIQPGNEYRQTDLRDFNIFNSKNVNAQFDGIEYSRFYKEGNKDLNGGSKYLFYKNEYAGYLNVTFQFKPPTQSYQEIFLVGAFNDWKVSNEFRLSNIGGVYKKTIPLKRGIYDYQYVTADVINNEIKSINWLFLEGNYWITSNAYYIFLYYNDPDYGGYDRIIGYQKFITR